MGAPKPPAEATEQAKPPTPRHVLLWMNFGHTGNSYGEGNALVTFEAFKVWDGQIQSILAFFKGLPIATARFWPSEDPVPR